MCQLQLTADTTDWNEYLLKKSICSICLTVPDLKTAVLTPRDHLFCRSCLDIWLKEHLTCPLCRDHVCQFYIPGLKYSFAQKRRCNDCEMLEA